MTELERLKRELRCENKEMNQDPNKNKPPRKGGRRYPRNDLKATGRLYVVVGTKNVTEKERASTN